MAGEWTSVKIEDLRADHDNSLATGPFGSAISSQFFQDDGVPVLRGSNLSQDVGRRLIDDGLVFVSPEKAKQFQRSIARRGDLVFTCWGTIDQVGLIDSRSRYSEYVVSNKQMKMTPHPKKADSLFLYYLLSSPMMRLEILNQGIGSSVPGFNLGQLRNLEVVMPPLREQRAIACILGALDDKIELNRRMNRTLESIARAIFKSWFVDFLPVRAKIAARTQTGLPVRAKMAAKTNEAKALLPQAKPGGWFVYAIECEDGSIYIGQTADLRQRWQQHVDGRAARWTKQHRPVSVVHWEELPSREAAVDREKWLKTGFGRKWLRKQIAASARTQTGDPVRAKAAGQSPPLPAPQSEAARQAGALAPHLAALFPDAFENSELGQIPKGWRVGTIDELADIVGGGTPSTKEPIYWAGGTHCWATPKDLSPLTVPVLLDTERRITDAGLERISSGLLPVGTVLLSSRAPIGYLAIAQTPVAINQGFIAMKPRLGVSGQFLLRWAEASHDAIVSQANGSTFLEISKKSFRPIPVIVPPERLHSEFDRVVLPAYQRVASNEIESRTLAALRDALLPKLISGELRVPDAERIVGRAV